MPSIGRASPYKGHPKSEWPAITAQLRAEKEHANAFGPVLGVELPPEPKSVRINSEPEVPDSIPRNLFSGSVKALDVMGANGSFEDPIPGYRLYWFNDIGGTGVRIGQAKLSGWEMVDKAEILLTENVVGNNDLGSHVSKVVNPNLTPPTKAYLMKKPKWLDQRHQDEREVMHQRIDRALRSGKLGSKPENRQYTKADDPSSSLPDIDISSNLYKENRNG